MTDNVVRHPYCDLMAGAKRERMIADSPEAQELMEAIYKAVCAYSDFLEELLWEFGLVADDPDWPRMKAEALVITADYCGVVNGRFSPTEGGPCATRFHRTCWRRGCLAAQRARAAA